MSWNGKRVLVTGAGGFIGSHLAELLAREGAEVVAFVRYNSRSDWGMLGQVSSEILDAIQVVAGDITDPYAVREAAMNIDVIFHLAAQIAIPYSYKHPRETSLANLIGTLNVLQAARDLDVQKVVHTSTSEVYGTAQTVPINESHPINPQSPYAATKAGADHLAQSFFLSFGLPVVTVRPFNTYGPRQSARAVVPAFISQALANGVIKLGATEPTRDLTYCTDTGRGFMALAEAPEAVGRVVNLGNNLEISIGDLARIIADLCGKDIPLEIDQQRLRPEGSEVMRLRVDNTLANELAGWAPTITLKEGLASTVEWIKENLALFKTDRYIV